MALLWTEAKTLSAQSIVHANSIKLPASLTEALQWKGIVKQKLRFQLPAWQRFKKKNYNNNSPKKKTKKHSMVHIYKKQVKTS